MLARLAATVSAAPNMARTARLAPPIAGLVLVATTFAILEKHVQVAREIAVPVLVTTIIISPLALRQAATGIVMAMSVVIILVITIMTMTVLRQAVTGIVITIAAKKMLLVAVAFMISTIVKMQVVLGIITATIVMVTTN